jgi:2-amino-4-hydroxy-6-hydroxymethyldihydropteridine diphosphokinase
MAVYIALGSNLGDRLANLQRALDLLPPDVRVEAISDVYESEPQPPAPPPAFLNAGCRVSTRLSPRELLVHLKRIEVGMGREPAPRWHPRIIDLDIALFDDTVIEEPDLVVPHVELIRRNFVLRPLLDIDPELRHPVTAERLADVLVRVGCVGLVRTDSVLRA